MALDTFVQDLRFGWRMLLKSPVLTGVAVLSLALGIGATTAIFSLINVFFVRAVPVSHPERVMFIYGTDAKRSGAAATWSYFPVSIPNFADLRAQTKSFSAVASFTFLPINLGAESGSPERVFGQMVDGNFFDLLGVKAEHGRTFLPEEDRTMGTHPVVVLSHTLWRRRFGSDPSWVGRTLSLNGRPFTVIGVAPPGFQGPTAVGGSELWLPMMMREQLLATAENAKQRRWRQFFIVGRLRPGIDRARAESEVRTIASRLEHEYPADNEGRGFTLLPVAQAGVNPNERGSQMRAGAMLLGATFLVLLIACSNVANLLLARSLARNQEIAVRLSQGASRRRLVRQLLLETLLLFTFGGGLGLLIAVWMRNLLWTIRPPFFAFLDSTIDLSLDRQVLAFNFLIALATGLIFGLVPALHATRRELVNQLREGSLGAGHGASGVRARDLLVAVQIALSMIALVGAGLFIRSLHKVQDVQPGFETKNLLQVTISLDGQSYPESRVRDYHKRVVAAVEALPGVQGASLATTRLMSANGAMMRTYLRQGIDENGGKGGTLIRTDLIAPGYFAAAGIPLVQGRDFTPFDETGKTPVAVVNEMTARRLWPGQPPIGRRFSIFGEPDVIEVVGVVKDIRSGTLSTDPEPTVYLALRQRFTPGIALLVRTSVLPESVLPAVRRAVQAVDPGLPLIDLETIAVSRGGSLWAPRVGAALLSAFALLALVMAAAGLYGVTSYSVEQRRRELAIRLVLGAAREDVFRLILLRTARAVGLGLALGVILALFFTRAISSFLFGVGSADAPTFLLILFILALVALVASLVPARRATYVQPGAVLRST
jgi:putative ABC transport system permease protein